jgi:hypothetical protein
MGYYRSDSIESYSTDDGGFVLLVTKRGRLYERRIEPHGFVTQIEAATILRPRVSRVAVYQWIKSGKLKDDIVDGVSMIRLSRLRKFAAKHGYEFAPPYPKI